MLALRFWWLCDEEEEEIVAADDSSNSDDSKRSTDDEVAAARSGRSEIRASSSAAPQRQLESGWCPSSESGRQQRPRTPSGILSVPSEIGVSSHPSTKKIKTKNKKGGSNDLMEDYAQLQKDANTYRQATLCEMERHNKEIEAIERMKTEQAVWDGKQKEMEYKRNLYQEYLNLKKTMPEKRIAKVFPDMAQFFGDNDDDDST